MGIEMFSTCRCRCRQVSRPAQHHPWLSKSHHIRVDGFASGLRFVPMLKTPRNRKIVKMLKLMGCNRSENCVSDKISMIFVDENFMKIKTNAAWTAGNSTFSKLQHIQPLPSASNTLRLLTDFKLQFPRSNQLFQHFLVSHQQRDTAACPKKGR